jgi:hypothetical protein
MNKHLPHMSSWAHDFVADVLSEGDLAVDLTAGKGRDTLFLYQTVGRTGRVLAFEIQQKAIENTASLLKEAGAQVTVWCANDQGLLVSPGVHLVHDSHVHLDRYLAEFPKAIIANLGYLPGGNREIVTETESTRTALLKALDFLAPGGRIAVVVYVGHPEGREERKMLETLCAGLSSKKWYVLRLEVANRNESPYLLVIEKRRK